MPTTKTCPYCAETIQEKATFCKHCKKDLHSPSVSYWRLVLKRWYLHLFLWPISLPVELINHLSNKRESNTMYMKKAGSEKQVSQLKEAQPSSPPDSGNKTLLSAKEKRIVFLIIFWLLAIPIGVTFYLFYLVSEAWWMPWLGFMIFFVWIWISPRKGERVVGFDGNAVQDRVKHYKKHKVRLILSIVAFLFATFAFALHLVNNIQENREWKAEQAILLEEQEKEREEKKKEKEKQEMIEAYPEPTIEVLSSQEHQGDSLEYELKIHVKDATDVYFGKEKMKQNPEENPFFSFMIPLDSPETSFLIGAKNKYKSTIKIPVITRNETPEEIQARVEQEAKEEQERLEAERLAQEAEAEKQRLAEEKAAEQARQLKEEQDQIIEEECQRDWPTDFQMQNYCKGLHYDGLATLALGKPSDIAEGEFKIIRSACASEWPRDFQMRAYCEGLQLDSVRELME